MQRNKKTFYILYLITFLMSLAYALPLYIESSFLKKYADVQSVGLFFTLATAFTLLAIYIFPQFIKKYTNYRVMVAMTLIHICGTLFLVYAINPLTALIFFIIHYVSIVLLGINLDVCLEDITVTAHTGHTRAVFLTIGNTAVLLGPIAMGAIITASNDYSRAYLASITIFALALILLFFFRTSLNDHVKYRRRNLLEIIKVMKRNANLARVFYLSFTLRIFYALMVLYTPVYLHEQIGFSWSSIGVIFTIMLTPFVFLELPAGEIADRYLGEKELMILGLMVMALSTSAIFFIQDNSFIIWSAVLFMTRVGAALLESMLEIYFFKIIKREDVDLINLFRDTHPAGWLVGSVAAVMILKFLTIQHVFLFLGIFILFSILPAAALHDTK